MKRMLIVILLLLMFPALMARAELRRAEMKIFGMD